MCCSRYACGVARSSLEISRLYGASSFWLLCVSLSALLEVPRNIFIHRVCSSYALEDLLPSARSGCGPWM